MAKKKSTIKVSEVLKFANVQLARTDSDATADYKKGICDMVEKVLKETNNYEGFMFVNSNDCEHGTLGYWSRKYLRNEITTCQHLNHVLIRK